MVLEFLFEFFNLEERVPIRVKLETLDGIAAEVHVICVVVAGPSIGAKRHNKEDNISSPNCTKVDIPGPAKMAKPSELPTLNLNCEFHVDFANVNLSEDVECLINPY